MKRLWVLLVLVATFGFASQGFAARYEVHVNGFGDPSRPGAVHPGVKVHVSANPGAQNAFLETEITQKLERILEAKGYVLTGPGDADFVVRVAYGVGSPGKVDWSGNGASGGGTGEAGMIQRHDAWGGSRTLFVRWMAMSVVDGASFGEGKKVREVWVSDVRSPGKSSDIREVANYLLVAVMEHFGEDTGQQMRHRIQDTDSRIQWLKRGPNSGMQ